MLVKNAFTVSWVSRSLSLALSLSLSHSLCVKQGSRQAQWHYFQQMTGQVVRQITPQAIPSNAERSQTRIIRSSFCQHCGACPAQQTLHRTYSYKDNKTAWGIYPILWHQIQKKSKTKFCPFACGMTAVTNELSVGSTLLQTGLVARFPDLCQCHSWVEPVEDAQR